jgi:NADH:ubiquinone oxidoreductase subunit C
MLYSLSTLTEISAIDTLKYTKIFPENEYYNKNKRFLMFNVYYTYFTKIRLTLVQSININTYSIESIYKNANWLERETSEMFGIGYINKKDSRPLLLDYSRNEFPMLKDFPTEGYYDIYYNFFENKLLYVQNEFIEL